MKRGLQTLEDARNYAEAIVDTVREPLLVLDAELRVKSASRAFYQKFAISPAATEGRYIYHLGDGHWDIPALRTLLEQVLPERRSFQDFEVIHDFPTLGRRVLLLNARQLWTRDNQLELVLLAIDDVTETKQIHSDLLASNEDLQRFASSAAHDLRAPLNSSLILSQILSGKLGGKLDENEAGLLAMLLDSMERLRRLMEDILNYSVSGHAPRELVHMSLAEPLNVALANLHHEIQSSHAQIFIGPLPELTLDRTQIAMLFQNLIDNALKYRRPEAPRIAIAALRLDSHWRVSISDNGQGFSNQCAAKVFEPYQRLSQSAIPGSGIGLAICHRIVQRIGGQIWAESTPGQGSTFSFTLPAL